jgi:hypothetical protein
MRKVSKSVIIVILIICVFPFQRIFAQDLPEEFEGNTIDTVPISVPLPFLLVGAIVFAFVFYRKMKAVVN